MRRDKLRKVIEFVGVAFLGLALASCAIGATIEWQLDNRFRAFDFESSQESTAQQSAERYEKLSYRDGDTPSGWIDRIEASGGSPYVSSTGPWIEDVNNINPRYADNYVSLPSQISISAKLSGLKANASHDVCEWSIDGLVVHTGQCGEGINHVILQKKSGLLVVRASGSKIAEELVRPTSFIIVGLGDSYGAGEGSPDAPTIWKAEIPFDEWPLGDSKHINQFVESPAKWQSTRCNRSFYSYQNLVALRVAARHPHESTVLVQFSCAGAEIIDGLLAPQRLPSGHPARSCKPVFQRSSVDELDPECDVPISQLNATVKALCAGSPSPIESGFKRSLIGRFTGTRYATHEPPWIKDLVECPATQFRRPDLVLLSIGGNDMGFSGVIAWGLLPSGRKFGIPPQVVWSNFITGVARKGGGVVCPYAGASDDCSSPKKLTAIQRIAELRTRLFALDMALTKLLQVEPEKIVANEYPNSLHDTGGNLCGNPPHKNYNNAWYAARTLIPRALVPVEWEINLTEDEAKTVNRAVIPALNKAIEDSAAELRWTAASMDGVMNRKGWCTGDAQTLLSPKDAHSWHPYANNTRAIRTGNDSFLTQWPGDTGRQDGIDGTFHPNGQGYAGMADAVLKVLH